jgi:uncharacterized protein (TIGR00255 family)
MHSMTGYGRGEATGKGTKITVEIQSVNKRQTEILVSLPSALTMMESEIRTKIDRSLHRGRVAVAISASGTTGSSLPVIDSELAARYLTQFKQLQRELSLPGDLTIDLILRSPGVISANAPGVFDSSVRSVVESALDLAIAQLLQMRAKEGSTLKRELLSRIRSMRQALAKVRKLQPRVTKRYRELLMERIRKIGLEIDVDDVRLTKEVALFAERSDFSEELSRLESHLDQFIAAANKEEAIGRTLEFIAQEIGRELNTLSAKANDAEISQTVVHCKAELEKIREQVQNVE